MEIIVKRDILDELQAKGHFTSAKNADKFVKMMLDEITRGIGKDKKVTIDGLGIFSGGGQAKVAKKIPSKEFLARIMDAFSIEKAKAKKDVAAFVHLIKEMLIKGYEVQLFDFAYFRIEEKKAQALKSPRKGQSSVIPARKVLVFEAEKALCEKTSVQAIQFAPDEEFRKHIGRLKSSSILLLVPNRDFFIQTFEYQFRKSGWIVKTTADIEEARGQIQAGKTQLAIVDSQVEDYQSICEIIKCNKETSHIPLIIMYPKGTDLKKTSGFRICGDEHLLQPFEIQQLIALAESVLKKSIEKNSIFKQELMYQFLTIDKYIEKANTISNKLFAISGLSEEDQISMGAALREAVANAAQHGNKHRRDKMLEVLYLLDKEKIIVSIADSGFGFDWRNFLTAGERGDAVGRARQSHREGRLGGLGIMLMLRCVDKLEYNDTGNEITLTKYIKEMPKK